MSELKIKGRLLKDFGIIQVSDKFKKREFVIETNDKYPQKVKFQLTQDKTDYLENYSLHDEMIVHFNIRGNEWKDSFFVNLEAWKIDKVNGSAMDKVQNAAFKETMPEGEDGMSNGEDGELPF